MQEAARGSKAPLTPAQAHGDSLGRPRFSVRRGASALSRPLVCRWETGAAVLDDEFERP